MLGTRNRFVMIGILGIVLAGGCAMQPKRGTLPLTYDCGARVAVETSASLAVDGVKATPFSTDSDGSHYVVTRGDVLVEYVVPEDPRLDATMLTYDTATPRDRKTWIPRDRGTCVAHAGFTNALSLFMKGKSTEEVAAELSLEPRDAQSLIHGALAYLRARLDY